jgi:DNA-directed RNA polymerase specialized sigma24 family protein
MGENHDGDDDGPLLAGDAHDFGRFYALHEDYVLTLFLARGAHAELAADLAAETFARALVARRSFDPARGAPRGWLTGIARHVLADSFRRGRVEDSARRKLGLERLQIDDTAIACIEELAEDRALTALEALPEDQRVSRGLRALRERLKESA